RELAREDGEVARGHARAELGELELDVVLLLADRRDDDPLLPERDEGLFLRVQRQLAGLDLPAGGPAFPQVDWHVGFPPLAPARVRRARGLRPSRASLPAPSRPCSGPAPRPARCACWCSSGRGPGSWSACRASCRPA